MDFASGTALSDKIAGELECCEAVMKITNIKGKLALYGKPKYRRILMPSTILEFKN